MSALIGAVDRAQFLSASNGVAMRRFPLLENAGCRRLTLRICARPCDR